MKINKKFSEVYLNKYVSDLIVMNIIKSKIDNNYMLHSNDEKMIIIIFKRYAKLIEEVLFSDEYNKKV